MVLKAYRIGKSGRPKQQPEPLHPLPHFMESVDGGAERWGRGALVHISKLSGRSSAQCSLLPFLQLPLCLPGSLHWLQGELKRQRLPPPAPFYKGGNRGPREFLDIGKATQLACPGVSGGAGKPLRPQSPGIVWPPAAPQPPQRGVLEVEQPEAGQSQATVSGRVAS